MKKQLQHSLLLFLAAAIWGSAFVAQSVGMDYVGPFTFNCVRSLIGGLVLIPVVLLFSRGHRLSRTTLAGGLCCGVILCLASNLQQLGLLTTEVGKAGFLTACYIVLVPILGLFLKKKAGLNIWIGVMLAVIGLYLLCMKDSLIPQAGDVYLILGAVLFAVHILVIDYFAPRADCIAMSCIQFLVCGALTAIPMFLFEEPQVSNILIAWKPILYAGAMSSGVAYTLQIIGQKEMNPTVASLILSLESVVAVLAGWLLLSQTLSVRELIGCVMMFAAIVLAQLPQKRSITEEEGVIS